MAVATKAKASPSRVAAPPRTVEPERVERPTAVPKDRAVAVGRDGKPIWRKSFDTEDRFHIPAGVVPDGWMYEWKRKSIFGQPDTTHQVNLQRNGWTPVPASRHPGLWMPVDYPGAVEIDGLALMEIPMALYREAKRDEKRAADEAVRGSRKKMGMGYSSPVADPSSPEARRVSGVKIEAPVPVLNQNKYEYTLDE